MSYIYSDATRVHLPHALPDVEVFRVSEMEAQYNNDNADHADEFTIGESGWYFWYCMPGYMPDDSIPHGPFETEEEAVQEAVLV